MSAAPSDDPRYERLLSAVRRAAGQGYDAVSMRELAAATRMSLTTIYGFAGSKDELIARAHAGSMESLQRQLAADPPPGATAEARVRATLAVLAAALDRDEVRTRTMLKAFYAAEPAIGPSRTSVGDSFATMLDAAIGDEDLADRETIVEVLGHVLDSVVMSWLAGRLTTGEVAERLDRTARMLLGPR